MTSSVPVAQDIEVALRAIAAGELVDQTLGTSWRLRVELRHPYLCVYRSPVGENDPGTEALLTTQTNFFLASGDEHSQKNLQALTSGILSILTETHQSALLVEAWTAKCLSAAADGGEGTFPIRLHAVRRNAPDEALLELEKSLLAGPWLGRRPKVSIEYPSRLRTPHRLSLLEPHATERLPVSIIGIELPPIFRDPATSEVYPQVLATLRKVLGLALRRTVYAFAHSRASYRPGHHHELGPSLLTDAVRRVDADVWAIDESTDLLFEATPVNSGSAWREFRRHRFERNPVFRYRALKASPALLKRKLFEIPLEEVEDPALHRLYEEKQQELDRRITMLAARGEPSFLHDSQQVFPAPSSELIRAAEHILRETPAHTRDDRASDSLTAEQFAERARKELRHYRNADPSLTARVEVRSDFPSLMVARGDLLVGDCRTVPRRRVEALLQHEVGTHIVTYHNGRQQPLGVFRAGLAGYNDLQEGLAVLAEIFSGGLSRPRLRQLAGRVVAVADLVDAAEFIDVFRKLHDGHGFSQSAAYSITMRVFRGGGLTKDASYLRGLLGVIDYLSAGGSVEPLLVGKIALAHVDIVKELWWRNILLRPRLRPRYLGTTEAQQKLKRLRRHQRPPLDFVLEHQR